jgi:hypothetical protein
MEGRECIKGWGLASTGFSLRYGRSLRLCSTRCSNPGLPPRPDTTGPLPGAGRVWRCNSPCQVVEHARDRGVGEGCIEARRGR